MLAYNGIHVCVQDDLCSVCLDAKRAVMFEPCRHVCVCEECAELLDRCPLCRNVCTGKVKLFF